MDLKGKNDNIQYSTASLCSPPRCLYDPMQEKSQVQSTVALSELGSMQRKRDLEAPSLTILSNCKSIPLLHKKETHSHKFLLRNNSHVSLTIETLSKPLKSLYEISSIDTMSRLRGDLNLFPWTSTSQRPKIEH